VGSQFGNSIKKDVHDHLTEIPPLCWVIAACQC